MGGGPSKESYFRNPDEDFKSLKNDIFQFQKRDFSNLKTLLRSNWRWNRAEDPWIKDIL